MIFSFSSLGSLLLYGTALALVILGFFLCVRLAWRVWREIKGNLTGDRRVDGGDWNFKEFGVVVIWTVVAYTQLVLLGAWLQHKGILSSANRQAIFLIVGQGFLYSLFFALLARWFWRKGLSWEKIFGLRKGRLAGVVLAAIGGLVAVIIPMTLAAWGMRCFLETVGWPIEPQAYVRLLLGLSHPGLLAGMIVLAVIGAPFFEETLFRGMLYTYLKRKVGLGNAVWLNAAVFAIFHGHIPSLLPLFLLAIMFTLLYEWQGNLLVPILCHAAFNAMVLVFVLTAPRLISILH